MKIEKKQKVVSYTVEEVSYIAKDGTEFKREWECLDYEREKGLEVLLEKAKSPAELRGYAPFNGSEYSEEHEYRWFFVESNEIMEEINSTYNLDAYHPLDESYIGTWICVESYDGDAWFESLDNCINYAKNVLDKLGYEMIVKEKKEEVK